MIRTKKDYYNLLEETVNYYKEDPSRRGYDSITLECVYKTKGGNMCAVGRCMEESILNKVGDSTDNVNILFAEYKNKMFKDQYQGFDLKFWELLQKLHDSNEV